MVRTGVRCGRGAQLGRHTRARRRGEGTPLTAVSPPPPPQQQGIGSTCGPPPPDARAARGCEIGSYTPPISLSVRWGPDSGCGISGPSPAIPIGPPSIIIPLTERCPSTRTCVRRVGGPTKDVMERVVGEGRGAAGGARGSGAGRRGRRPALLRSLFQAPRGDHWSATRTGRRGQRTARVLLGAPVLSRASSSRR